jgi:hypothetical protein
MPEYVPPLRDIRFVLEQLVDLDGLVKLEAYAHVDIDTVFGVIEESGRFMADVVGPLNRVGGGRSTRSARTGPGTCGGLTGRTCSRADPRAAAPGLEAPAPAGRALAGRQRGTSGPGGIQVMRRG